VIEQVWRDSRCASGWPRVLCQPTRRRGAAVSCRWVARIMRAHGCVGAHTRERSRRGRPEVAPTADHLPACLRSGASNLQWVADITEFPAGEGKLHLAAIRVLCHRGIVGWTMDELADLGIDDVTVMPLTANHGDELATLLFGWPPSPHVHRVRQERPEPEDACGHRSPVTWRWRARSRSLRAMQRGCRRDSHRVATMQSVESIRAVSGRRMLSTECGVVHPTVHPRHAIRWFRR
jgi:hypothetical protein